MALGWPRMQEAAPVSRSSTSQKHGGRAVKEVRGASRQRHYSARAGSGLASHQTPNEVHDVRVRRVLDERALAGVGGPGLHQAPVIGREVEAEAVASLKPLRQGGRQGGLEDADQGGFERLQVKRLGEEAASAQLPGQIPAAYGRHDEDGRTALGG